MQNKEEVELAMAQTIEDRGLNGCETMPPLFTISEVAKYLQVSTATVYRLLKDGCLTGVRIGQSLRFTRKNIEDLLEACTVDSNA